ncbi:MAG: hypothetical protein PHI85_09075 [Victivallaceae bacterium]|nr:hypothetical protein [Victivallaceae bacterium]
MLLSGDSGEYTVPGKNLTVNVSYPLERKDLSGSGSSTGVAAAGDKPKTVSCAFQLPQGELDKLTELVNLAGRRDTVGDPAVYRVSDELVNAMQVRQVIFDGDVSAVRDDSLCVYNISFKLREVASIPEKLEQRLQDEVKRADDAKPETVAADPAELNAAIEEELA